MAGEAERDGWTDGIWRKASLDGAARRKRRATVGRRGGAPWKERDILSKKVRLSQIRKKNTPDGVWTGPLRPGEQVVEARVDLSHPRWPGEWRCAASRWAASARCGELSRPRAAASTPAPSHGFPSRTRVARLPTATTRRCGRSGSRSRVSQARRLPPGRSTANRAMQNGFTRGLLAVLGQGGQLAAAECHPEGPHQPRAGGLEGPASPTCSHTSHLPSSLALPTPAIFHPEHPPLPSPPALTDPDSTEPSIHHQRERDRIACCSQGVCRGVQGFRFQGFLNSWFPSFLV